MKRRPMEIIFILIGVLLVLYPFISDLVGKYTQTEAISKYREVVNSLTNEEKNEQLEKAREYNQQLNKEKKTYDSYMNVLNIGDVIAYINIPKIGVNLPIYHGVSENVLQTGVGHIEGTSLPVGGKGTHAVLSGHTGLVRAKMFDDIDKLVIGDRFYINVLNDVLVYQVDDIKVVLPSDVGSIATDENEDYITLVTCTPYMINTHRLLVRGTRTVPEETNEEELAGEVQQAQEVNAEEMNTNLWRKVITIVNLIIIVIIMIFC